MTGHLVYPLPQTEQLTLCLRRARRRRVAPLSPHSRRARAITVQYLIFPHVEDNVPFAPRLGVTVCDLRSTAARSNRWPLSGRLIRVSRGLIAYSRPGRGYGKRRDRNQHHQALQQRGQLGPEGLGSYVCARSTAEAYHRRRWLTDDLFISNESAGIPDERRKVKAELPMLAGRAFSVISVGRRSLCPLSCPMWVRTSRGQIPSTRAINPSSAA